MKGRWKEWEWFSRLSKNRWNPSISALLPKRKPRRKDNLQTRPEVWIVLQWCVRELFLHSVDFLWFTPYWLWLCDSSETRIWPQSKDGGMDRWTDRRIDQLYITWHSTGLFAGLFVPHVTDLFHFCWKAIYSLTVHPRKKSSTFHLHLFKELKSAQRVVYGTPVYGNIWLWMQPVGLVYQWIIGLTRTRVETETIKCKLH